MRWMWRCLIKSFRIYQHFKFKMRLSWHHVCYMCQAPLDPRVITAGKENKKFVRNYKHIRPLFTYNNEQYYSFAGGLKLRRVCYSCFSCKCKVHHTSLRNRELCGRGRVAPKSKSRTEKEILFWFNGLLRRAAKEGIDIKK
mgnify:FL=1